MKINKLTGLTIVLSSFILSLVFIGVVKGQVHQTCPEGYVERGGCVQITNCPYGDSMTREVCDKSQQPDEFEKTKEPAQPIQPVQPAQQPALKSVSSNPKTNQCGK